MSTPAMSGTAITLLVAGVMASALAAAAQAVLPQPAVAPAAAVPELEPEQAAAAVQSALRATPGVPAEQVVVSTHADTVVLTGEVDSQIEAARAVSVAEQAAGGLRVSSQLSVRPAEQQAAREQSLQLVRSIEQALRHDERTANLGVAVSVDEAQVIGLHGLVPTRESRTIAEDVAGRVAGARRIRSHLLVPGE